MTIVTLEDKSSIHKLISAACAAHKSNRLERAESLMRRAERLIEQLAARGDSSYSWDLWREFCGVRSSLGIF